MIDSAQLTSRANRQILNVQQIAADTSLSSAARMVLIAEEAAAYMAQTADVPAHYGAVRRAALWRRHNIRAAY